MRIQIHVGTGGVGKTSVTAARALAAAMSGERTLVLTIDPARRLRTALGLDAVSTEAAVQQRVNLDAIPGVRGELHAAMLDVASSLNRAVRLHASAKQADEILAHPIYKVLLESLAGMQELMAVERLDQAIEEGFDSIYVDTAPSRHALEFVDKPEFFAQLVSFPIVRLVGRTYRWWEKSGIGRLSKGTFELYTRVEEMLGANLTRQVLDFFSIFRGIAEGYAHRARHTAELLRDPAVTTFTVVTSPLKAVRDADFFLRELEQRKFRVSSLIVNRVWPRLQLPAPDNLPTANLTDASRQLLQGTIDWYAAVSSSHQTVWNHLQSTLGARIERLAQLPELPEDIAGLSALQHIAQQLGEANSA
jgi:anion-transporting  ArsA/GET3 family ATPase